MAHELNQPLTSILANAEAGARLLEEEPADKQEIKEILSDIVAEDKRAAAVIAQLRRLMLKGETDRAEDFLLNHKPEVPGCAIIDLNLPGMDGLSLQEALSSGRFIRPAISARAFS